MPKQKDLKRLVRARMQKTGESYTSARTQVIAKRATPAPKLAPATQDLAAIAGMSDAAVKKGTGCDWSRWVKSLDQWGAAKMSHKEIAELIHSKWKASGWWSQMVAVGYERVRGLREKGQKRSGSYTIGKSRTFPVAVEQLFAAFTPPRLSRWLDGAKPTVRKATAPKSVRITWEDGTKVEVILLKKGETKSQAQIQHDGFLSKAAAERMRAWWTERMATLGEQLA